ncbi:MAG: hypothetical protein ABII00_02455 [Elusimicrobiota bacterium]
MAETRLTNPPLEGSAHQERVAGHNFRRVADKILITNDAGHGVLLGDADFLRYLKGGVSNEEPLGTELRRKGFFRNYLDFRALAGCMVERWLLDWKGPAIHTIAVSGRAPGSAKRMSPATAKKAVDFVFSGAAPALLIELRGGGRRAWPVVRFIVRYAKKKSEVQKRSLCLRLLAEPAALDGERARWLDEQGVTVCALLAGDGVPAPPKGAREAVFTVTRAALSEPEKTVERLIAAGIESVEFRRSEEGDVPVGRYLEFYRKALAAVVEACRGGKKLRETAAAALLARITGGGRGSRPDGEGLCSLAYGPDGDIYTSDEGLLLGEAGDPLFRIGRLGETGYDEALGHPMVRAALLAASPSTQPFCFQCAYQPYCRVRPVYNYRTQGGLWGHMPSNAWCETMMGIFDILVEGLQGREGPETLKSWAREVA